MPTVPVAGTSSPATRPTPCSPWPAPAASTAGSARATTRTSPIPTRRCAPCSASSPRRAREVHQAAVQRRRDVRPRVHRGGVYPLLRSFTTVLTRDVIVATLVGDMRAGRSVVYADFVGYDEVAHHSGVERYDALETLRRLDREFARLRAGRSRLREALRVRGAVRPRPESGRDVPHPLRPDPRGRGAGRHRCSDEAPGARARPTGRARSRGGTPAVRSRR